MVPTPSRSDRWRVWFGTLSPGQLAVVSVAIGGSLLALAHLFVPGFSTTVAGDGSHLLTHGAEVAVAGVIVYGLLTARDRTPSPADRRFDRFVEFFPNGGVGIFDRSKRFVDAGGLGLEHLDLEAADIVGQTPAEVFPDGVAAVFERHMGGALEGTEQVFEVEVQGRHYQLQTAPLETAGDTVTRGIVVATDVTERKQRELELAKREETYRNLVENSPAPINLFDDDGEIVWGNQALLDLLGMDTRQELEGRNIFEFIHPDDKATAAAELEEVMTENEIVGPTEFRIRRDDGALRYIQAKTTRGWFEGQQVGQVVVTDVTPLHEAQKDIEENEERYRTLVEMSPDPILVSRDARIVYANPAMVEMVEETDREAVLGKHINEFLETDEHEDARAVARATQAGEFEPSRYERTLVTTTGNRRQIETTSRSISYEDQPAVLTLVQDVTDRHRHEHVLETLHHRTHAMTRATGASTICDIAVQTADDLLELDGSVFFSFEDGELHPNSWSDGLSERLDDEAVEALRTGILWESFVADEATVIEDSKATVDLLGVGPLEGAFVIPVGTHGVILGGSTEPVSLTAANREVAHLIAESLEAALDRTEKEVALGERDRRLREQNATLEEVNRLNEIIRNITQSLIQTATEPEIKDAVCEHFASAQSYTAAWVCTRVPGDGTLSVDTWSGMDAEYVDYLESEFDAHPLADPIEAAFEDGTVEVRRQILSDPNWEGHRSDVLTQGYRSIAVVPILVDGFVESVLVIHGTQGDIFEAEEQSVLGELGQMIGYALENVSELAAIRTDKRTAVEVGIGDERLFLNHLVADTDLEISWVGAFEESDDTLHSFLRIGNLDDSDIEARLEALESVTDVRPMAREESTGLFQVTSTIPALVKILQRNNAHLRSMTARDGTTDLTVVLLGGHDVRSLVEDIQATYPKTELLARHSDTEPVETPEQFRDRILEELTEKQLEALQTAHYGGFFEWPRVSNSEELAATRGIAASTFQHHLRAAERKVFEAMLDGD